MMGFFVEGTVANCYSPLLAGKAKHKEEVRRQGGGAKPRLSDFSLISCLSSQMPLGLKGTLTFPWN